jgi:hypothetical protein
MAHYVNNAEFLAALKEYKLKLNDSKEKGTEPPRIPNYIGECLLKIATHLSYKANFINYSYKDEMISDGIENCIQYLHNFNPDKSSNPFAYFTQIIYYAFLRRIAKEKKQSAVKQKLIREMPIEMFDIQDHDSDNEYHNAFLEYLQSNSDFQIDEPKKKGKKKRGLEKFIDGEDDVADNLL